MYSTNNLKTLIENHFKIINDAIDEANKNSGVTPPAAEPPSSPAVVDPTATEGTSSPAAGKPKTQDKLKTEDTSKPQMFGLESALKKIFKNANNPHPPDDQEWDEDDTDGKK